MSFNPRERQASSDRSCGIQHRDCPGSYLKTVASIGHGCAILLERSSQPSENTEVDLGKRTELLVPLGAHGSVHAALIALAELTPRSLVPTRLFPSRRRLWNST